MEWGNFIYGEDIHNLKTIIRFERMFENNLFWIYNLSDILLTDNDLNLYENEISTPIYLFYTKGLNSKNIKYFFNMIKKEINNKNLGDMIIEDLKNIKIPKDVCLTDQIYFYYSKILTLWEICYKNFKLGEKLSFLTYSYLFINYKSEELLNSYFIVDTPDDIVGELKSNKLEDTVEQESLKIFIRENFMIPKQILEAQWF